MKVKQQQHISIFVGCGSLHPPLHNAPTHKKKLDDGWPESVEEQGLLLLVWRHHMTGQYIKDVL